MPEAGEVRGLAQVVRHKFEQGLCSLVPELLAPFHTAVDLLDGRFNVAGGNWEAELAVRVVLHASALVPEIPERPGDDRGGRRLVAFARWAKFSRARRDRRNELVDRPFP